MVAAGAGSLVLEPQEVPKFDHFFVEGRQGGMIDQELLKLVLMPFLQPAGMAPQHAWKAPMGSEFRNDLAGQIQEVMLEEADDVEPISHDTRVGEPAPHQGPVGTGEVNADHLDLLAALQSAQEARQFACAAPRHDVEDPTVL